MVLWIGAGQSAAVRRLSLFVTSRPGGREAGACSLAADAELVADALPGHPDLAHHADDLELEPAEIAPQLLDLGQDPDVRGRGEVIGHGPQYVPDGTVCDASRMLRPTTVSFQLPTVRGGRNTTERVFVTVFVDGLAAEGYP